MEEYPFFESIRLNKGRFELTGLHQNRIKATQRRYFGDYKEFELAAYLSQFQIPLHGLYKCRLPYGVELAAPAFVSYTPRPISSLLAINADALDYSSKFADRSQINSLLQKRQQCDDILIIQHGLITDTSYCNIIFSKSDGWYTPEKPLLQGVQRQHLLNTGVIKAIPINISDLAQFKYFRLVNAMIPWEESVPVPIEKINIDKKLQHL